MFELFKKKQSKANGGTIGAPVEGEAVPSSAISDPAFRGEMLGKGMAIKPSAGEVYAPVSGTIAMVFDTKHAISINSDEGAEILVHVGLDTISLKGVPFTIHVTAGQKVKKGDLLLEFDMEAIIAAGLDTITPVIICNPDGYKEIRRFTGKQVKPGDAIMELVK